MKDSQKNLQDTLADLAKQRRQGRISRTSVDQIVAAFHDLTLAEAERQLSVTETNDVRQRASYSKNRYYSRPSSETVERRRERVRKLLGHAD